MNKREIIDYLKHFPYSCEGFWIITGAAMVLYGIKEQTSDIDMGCSKEIADQLEQDGYTYRITEIEKVLGIARHTLRAELKRGLSESDFNNQRYIKYDPLMAMDSLVKEVINEESLKLLMNYWKAKKKGDR